MYKRVLIVEDSRTWHQKVSKVSPVPRGGGRGGLRLKQVLCHWITFPELISLGFLDSYFASFNVLSLGFLVDQESVLRDMWSLVFYMGVS